MQTEQRAIAGLRAHPDNYNRHSPEQIAKLADSLRTFGQQKNICVTEDGLILAGHGLVEAARSLGWTEIACKVYDGEGDPRAWLIADNYLATLADPDPASLAALLQSLQDVGQLEATGYDYTGLNDLIETLGEVEEGATPELARKLSPTDRGRAIAFNLGEHHDYIVLMFRDTADFRRALDHFRIEDVRAGTERKWRGGKVV